ncbi:WecB/TagA/CpsF family glycosyltransferase [Planctomycetota bacterium]
MKATKCTRIRKKNDMARVKVNILGVNIAKMNMPQVIQAVKQAIQKKQKLFVVVPNVFVVTKCNRDEGYRKIINSADIALADGMPLVWASYFLGQYTGGRVCGPDFFSKFNMIAEEEGYSSYYLGGGPGGSEKVAENLKRRHPSLKIAGNFSPPLGEISSRLSDEIIERINAAKPDILWVGLGSPRQERWIHRYFYRLRVIVAVGVGAAFDYETGKKRRGPRWMQKVGIEWLYRILQNPARFWNKRCYTYLWEFILPIFIQVLKKHMLLLKDRGIDGN